MALDRNIWLKIPKDRVDELELMWGKDVKFMTRYVEQLQLNGETALDVACGTGAYFPFLKSKFKKYVGLDSSEIMLLRAKAKYPHTTFVLGDAKKLQYPDKSFDLVFCMSLFIHMPLPTVKQVLSELYRVSKKYVVFNVQITDEPVIVDYVGTWGEYVSIINQLEFNRLVDSYKPKGTKDIVYDRCERGGPCYKKFKTTYYKGHLVLMER